MEQIESLTCTECGVSPLGNMSCKDMLDWIIGWESEDQELSKEHFRAVACNNLRHPSLFNDEALLQLLEAFMEYMDEGLDVSEIRGEWKPCSEATVKC